MINITGKHAVNFYTDAMAITRRKFRKKFIYYLDGQEITEQATIERINALAIPPAWTGVEIATSEKEKIQASGIDKAGRTQAIYSAAFREKQEQAKYKKILRFAEMLPVLRAQVEKDLKKRTMSKDKVVACVVKLIDEQFFRVGNKQYAKERGHYGVTTLRSKHITEESTSRLTFEFIGKSGQKHVKKITNPQLVRIIRALEDMPGYELFRYVDEHNTMHDVTSTQVNEYIKQHMGEEFSAKDFRTWGGTLLAASLLLDEGEYPENKTAKKKMITTVVKRVARRLGNTPAVARQSYIDPKVLSILDDKTALTRLKHTMKRMKPKTYRTIEEQCVLELIDA